MKTNLAFIWCQTKMCKQMVFDTILVVEAFRTDVTLKLLRNVCYIHLLYVRIFHEMLMVFGMVYREMVFYTVAPFECFRANLNKFLFSIIVRCF